MRSTRASAALARLNARSDGHHYRMAMTGSGLFILRERIGDEDRPLSAALSLDEFVRLADSIEPPQAPRITKSEAAFIQQLVKKDSSR